MHERSDEQGMAAVMAGDQMAFASLVTRHHTPLLGYPYRLTGGDRQLAEGLVQETLLHVLKAYHELERDRLVESRPGQGTSVQRTLAGTSLSSHAALRRSLVRWLHSAAEAGLDSESVLALFLSTFQDTQQEHEETA